MNRLVSFCAAIPALALGACAVQPPPGPTVLAMPGPNKPFEVFQQDDYACRQYAAQQTGGVTPGAAATQSAVGSAALGTALGAAAGAAIGSFGGAVGAGAAIGAATGLVAGSAMGANAAAVSAGNVQQVYDISYTQCIYAHGDFIQAPPPGYAGYPPYGAPYPYAYGGYYAPAYVAPSVAIGFGGGWWGGGWGWHGGGGGWNGGGWHGGGWNGGGGGHWH